MKGVVLVSAILEGLFHRHISVVGALLNVIEGVDLLMSHEGDLEGLMPVIMGGNFGFNLSEWFGFVYVFHYSSC